MESYREKVDKLFSKYIGEKTSYQTVYRLAKEFLALRGPSYGYSRRGRRLVYDPIIVTYLLVVKMALKISDREILRKAAEWNFNARLDS